MPVGLGNPREEGGGKEQGRGREEGRQKGGTLGLLGSSWVLLEGARGLFGSFWGLLGSPWVLPEGALEAL
jgi:hypothetical protein